MEIVLAVVAVLVGKYGIVSGDPLAYNILESRSDCNSIGTAWETGLETFLHGLRSRAMTKVMNYGP